MTRESKEMLTGWGIVDQTHEIAALVGELRANEVRLRRRWQDLAPGEAADLLWQMASEGVCEARAWGGGGAPMLVSYVDCYHMHREELSALVRSVLLGEADPGELVALQLRFLLGCAAKRNGSNFTLHGILLLL